MPDRPCNHQRIGFNGTNDMFHCRKPTVYKSTRNIGPKEPRAGAIWENQHASNCMTVLFTGTIREDKNWLRVNKHRNLSRFLTPEPLRQEPEFFKKFLSHQYALLTHPSPNSTQCKLPHAAHHLSFGKLKSSNNAEKFTGREMASFHKIGHQFIYLLAPGLLVLNYNASSLPVFAVNFDPKHCRDKAKLMKLVSGVLEPQQLNQPNHRSHCGGRQTWRGKHWVVIIIIAPRKIQLKAQSPNKSRNSVEEDNWGSGPKRQSIANKTAQLSWLRIHQHNDRVGPRRRSNSQLLVRCMKIQSRQHRLYVN